MPTLVLLRHGESDWNHENRFTGWTDVDLSTRRRRRGARGRPAAQAPRACTFDVAYTSRAQARHPHAVDRARRARPDVAAGAEDRGASTSATTARCRASTRPRPRRSTARSRCTIWRRSYDIPPPPLERGRRALPGQRPRATRSLAAAELPRTECLKDTVARVLPYWHEAHRAGGRRRASGVLIAAHGNSLRALVKYLDGISDEDIVGLNIPTGVPAGLRARRRPASRSSHHYLGDAAGIEAAIAAVAAQGTAGRR